MAKHRLINCEFLNAGSFKVNVSNKAKLLYLSMLTAADDLGFVDTTQDIVNALKKNDNDFEKTENMALFENTYETALQDLLDKGYLYEFQDSHYNKVHLIRHWFFHNKLIKGLWTNYGKFKDMVVIRNNEYVMKPLKEDNINQSNINQDKPKQDNESIEDLLKTPSGNNSTEQDEFDELPFSVDQEKLKKGKK